MSSQPSKRAYEILLDIMKQNDEITRKIDILISDIKINNGISRDHLEETKRGNSGNNGNNP